MTTLGLGAMADSATSVGVQAGFRTGWLRHVGVAVGGASGAAIVLGGYEVLRSQPDKAFALLQSWGPAFLLTLVAVTLVAGLGGELIEAIRESFKTVASSVRASADSAGRTADALTRLAEQGGRQAEQVERLAIYAAQEFPGVYERLDKQDDILQELLRGQKALHTMLDRNDREPEAGDGSGA